MPPLRVRLCPLLLDGRNVCLISAGRCVGPPDNRPGIGRLSYALGQSNCRIWQARRGSFLAGPRISLSTTVTCGARSSPARFQLSSFLLNVDAETSFKIAGHSSHRRPAFTAALFAFVNVAVIS